REHDVRRQRRVVVGLLVADLDAPLRRLLDLATAGGLGAAGRLDVRALARADARVTIAARTARGTATDRDLLATVADVGDLRAEVCTRAALAHVALGRAVRALAREQVGHRARGLLLLELDVGLA